MKKIILALLCAVFAHTALADQLATDKKIYKDTVIWPILSNIVLCRPNASGLGPNPTKAQLDACWASMQGQGYRFPTLETINAEVDRSTTLHANIARGKWQIKTAQTPEELPYWNTRCGSPDKVTQVPMATTFEECEAKVSKWSNQETKAAFLTRDYIVDENGNWVDHRNAYTIQPGWAKRLGHTNPRFATNIWNSKLATLKSKLAAAAPK